MFAVLSKQKQVSSVVLKIEPLQSLVGHMIECTVFIDLNETDSELERQRIAANTHSSTSQIRGASLRI